MNTQTTRAGRPVWSVFVRTNSGIGIQAETTKIITSTPTPGLATHSVTCVCTLYTPCASLLHILFSSFIRLFSLKMVLVQCVHFLAALYIYTHILLLYYTNFILYIDFIKKLHKVHT